MRSTRLAGLLAAACLVGGCAASHVDYRPNARMEGLAAGRARVAVVRFDAACPPDQAPNLVGAMMLPLYMYTQKKISTEPWFYTEADAGTGALVRSSLKRMEACLAEDLDASGLVKRAEHTTWAELKQAPDRYDLVVTGTLQRDLKVITYFTAGVPLVGFLAFSLLPLPTCFASRHLVLTIQVADPRRPLEPLFEKTYAASRGGVGVFGMMGWITLDLHNNEDTPELYRDAFASFRKDLATELAPGGKLSGALARGGN